MAIGHEAGFFLILIWLWFGGCEQPFGSGDAFRHEDGISARRRSALNRRFGEQKRRHATSWDRSGGMFAGFSGIVRALRWPVAGRWLVVPGGWPARLRAPRISMRWPEVSSLARFLAACHR
ncbi:hypothetical protein, partial [Paracoccus simplex]